MYYSPETGELDFLGDFGDLTNVGKIIEYDGKIIFDATIIIDINIWFLNSIYF